MANFEFMFELIFVRTFDYFCVCFEVITCTSFDGTFSITYFSFMIFFCEVVGLSVTFFSLYLIRKRQRKQISIQLKLEIPLSDLSWE